MVKGHLAADLRKKSSLVLLSTWSKYLLATVSDVVYD